jgi:hypothetical protein
LHCWVVPDLGICSHSHWIIETVDHCSEADVTMLCDRDVAEYSCVGSYMSWLGNGERIILDVENVAMPIYRL